MLEGDALDTLAGIDGPVGFVLLDGWKELYLPVFSLLEDKLAPGALVVADNAANGYVSVAFPVRDGDSMEISCRAIT